MTEYPNYTQAINDHIACSHAVVQGDGYKFEAIVVSDTFQGQRILQRHKAVYAALDRFITSGELHALSIKAYTDEEWQQHTANSASL